MRFWQAVVVAQLSAGSVWADRYHGLFWLHMLAEAGSVVIGYFMWRGFAWVFGEARDRG